MNRLVALGCVLSLVAATGCAHRRAAGVAGLHCGKDRWKVKTASDDRIKDVVLKPAVSVTVADLTARDKPKWGRKMEREVKFDGTPVVEITVWKACVDLKKWSLQRNDKDIHLDVVDPGKTEPTMIIEFPDTSCDGAITSPLKTELDQARGDLIKAMGKNPPTKPTTISGRALVTGIGFFDREHRLGKETIELHPALTFEMTNCTPPKSTVTSPN